MSPVTDSGARYVVLSGGVGGARFADGLARELGAQAAQLTVIANTGDDFSHLGLAISPDLDTLMYTLAGCADEGRGWGWRDETWSFMAALEALGGETWFRLGDRDLATHVERTRRLAAGETLTGVTRTLCTRLGVSAEILPMCDGAVRTRLDTDEGELDFQDYFVRRQARPVVRRIDYAGAMQVPPGATLAARLTDPALAAIFIAPSNPLLSIAPILAIPSLRAALRSAHAPRIAISPIIAGQALRGPAARLLHELGFEASASGVAAYYGPLLDGFLVDEADAALVPALASAGLAVRTAPAVMRDVAARRRLARCALDFATALGRADTA